MAQITCAAGLAVVVAAAGAAQAQTNRAINGWGNNLANPEWGQADSQLLRMMPASYGDGISGRARPSQAQSSDRT
ncbi:MAG: peroxidase family protein [Planctomycetota bacterium]